MQVGSEERYVNPDGPVQKVRITVPQRKLVSVFPLLIAFIIVGLEFVAVFVDIILNAVNKDQEGFKSLTDTKGVLSPSALQFHLTWGLILTMALTFIEDAMAWLMNRKKCNAWVAVNGVACGLFVAINVYTWMWVNNAAGMTFLCKYFLLAVSVRVSPEAIRAVAYNSEIKFYCDLALSWLFPVQCVIVLVDCIVSLCCKPQPRVVTLRVKTDSQLRIICKVDPDGL